MDPDNERRGQIWLAYSSAAVAGLSQVQEEGDDDQDALLHPEEIRKYAEEIADEMLLAYEKRFKPKTRRRRVVDDD